ncbi:MAG: inorganic phosphate transporter [Rikenellaceae bacterium]
METIFTVIVVIIAALAISDLIVGVSNDATNFLNSAIGSKAAPRYVIMIVASIGILLGSTFASGMMEVARNGVFFPAQFTFQEIMMLFLAVMITDVILLDLYNTLGLPTSTTVSLVFELLGSAVAVACYKIWTMPEGISATISQYINATKALGIISGILMSVVIAFICGAFVMYVTRLIFSFRYSRMFKFYGSIWCGFALTVISYFTLFKGFKGSSLVSPDLINLINSNLLPSLGVIFVMWIIIMMFLQFICKFNILKLTILAGTFSLALAFAGNDLVNFIGVFMGSYDSYNIASETGNIDMMMGDLAKPVSANVPILLFSGVVMIITLWFSKKARNVSDTEISLATRDEGIEKFGSTAASRAIVRSVVNLNKRIDKFVPKRVQNFINSRFEPVEDDSADKAPFDLIRATVNLTTASILIASATSLKLPLSTTYVTFMVAMGSSLSDRAWGRDSAVYRITGVLTVVSGWFLTALVAFSISFGVALVLMYGGIIGVIAMSCLCAFLLIQSNFLGKRKKAKAAISNVKESSNGELTVEEEIINSCKKKIVESVQQVTQIYDQTLVGLFTEDRKLLKNMVKESEKIYSYAHQNKMEVHNVLRMLNDNYISSGHYYVQVADYLNEVAKALVHITKPSFEHIDNNHSGFSEEQIADLKEIEDKVQVIYGMINYMLKNNDFSKIDQTLHLRDTLFDDFAQITKRQISRIKTAETSTRTSMLYLNVISETKTMILQSRNLLKAQKDFVSK